MLCFGFCYALYACDVCILCNFTMKLLNKKKYPVPVCIVVDILDEVLKKVYYGCIEGACKVYMRYIVLFF
jgi:hypothetical protein